MEQVVSQQTRDLELMLDQCWPAVYDVGPTSNQHCFNVSDEPRCVFSEDTNYQSVAIQVNLQSGSVIITSPGPRTATLQNSRTQLQIRQEKWKPPNSVALNRLTIWQLLQQWLVQLARKKYLVKISRGLRGVRMTIAGLYLCISAC